MEALYNGGVFGRDGCIYSFNHVRKKLLKIDVVNNTYSLVGNEDICRFYGNWGNAILGNDGCIYWPPRNVNRTMKFDPETQATSLVGDDFGNMREQWFSGAVASDWAIYYLPTYAGQVLRIDPFLEFAKLIWKSIRKYLASSSIQTTSANPLHAIIKYGKAKVFQVIDDIIPSSIMGRQRNPSVRGSRLAQE